MKLGKTLKIVFIIIFTIICIIDYIILYFSTFENHIETFNLLILFIGVIIFNIFRFGLIIGGYIAFKLGKRKAYKEKLNKDDINNKEYFRNILKCYSPLELSYIDDFNIDNKKDIVACLLNMKKNKIIRFNELEKKIEYVENNKNLKEVEQELLNKIHNGKININDEDINQIKKIVQKSCKDKKILEEDNKSWNEKKLVVFSIIFLFCYFITMFSGTTLIGSIILFIICIFMLSIPYLMIFLFFYIISYNQQKINNPYIRSKLGEEVNKKLEGLKKYLKEFSNLDERNLEEIIIWEDYLIYSVLFNQNKKIIDDIYNKYFIK